MRLVVLGGLGFTNALFQILNKFLQAITANIQGSSKQTMGLSEGFIDVMETDLLAKSV